MRHNFDSFLRCLKTYFLAIQTHFYLERAVENCMSGGSGIAAHGDSFDSLKMIILHSQGVSLNYGEIIVFTFILLGAF